MERNHIIGMICGYYLSRFDERAYKRWRFASKKETHRELGKLLDVPTKSIENWRDEFDPVHDNPRQGWHKRKMAPSRCRVLEALDDLSEAELFAILQNAIDLPEGKVAEVLINSVAENGTDRQERVFGSRGITGRKAEELFIGHYEKYHKPVSGKLIDRRDEGCGYDFGITGLRKAAAIEVKGLAGLTGGISFTEKEWFTAQEMRDSYYLVIVRNVVIVPRFSFVQNPATNLNSHQHVYTTLHLSYSIPGRCLKNVEENITD